MGSFLVLLTCFRFISKCACRWPVWRNKRKEKCVHGTFNYVFLITIASNSPAKRIHKWMAAPDTSPVYNTAREKHQMGTGSWFLEGNSFGAWQRQPGSVLWLQGGRMCLKFIITSIFSEIHYSRNWEDNLKAGYAILYLCSPLNKIHAARRPSST